MSMIGAEFLHKSIIMDIHMDILSMWIKTKTSRQNFIKVERFIPSPKDTPKDKLFLGIAFLTYDKIPRIFRRTFCPSEIGMNSWTNALTFCQIPKH